MSTHQYRLVYTPVHIQCQYHYTSLHISTHMYTSVHISTLINTHISRHTIANINAYVTSIHNSRHKSIKPSGKLSTFLSCQQYGNAHACIVMILYDTISYSIATHRKNLVSSQKTHFSP